MIERGLWVTTDLFENRTPGADFINPRCFGEDFADWLRSRLTRHNLDVSEPIQEDWGWVLLVDFEERKFTVSIGVTDDAIGQTPAVWRVGVAYEKPLNKLRNLFKPAPVKSLTTLFEKLQSELASEHGFVVSTDEP
jgi:hypothetical protein